MDQTLTNLSSSIFSQWIEFLLFAGLVLGVCIIFSIMAAFYSYVDPEQMEKVYLEDPGKDENDHDDMKNKKVDMLMKEPRKNTKL